MRSRSRARASFARSALASGNDDKDQAISELEQVIEKDKEFFPDNREWSLKAVVLIVQLKHSQGNYAGALQSLEQLFPLLQVRARTHLSLSHASLALSN